MEMRVLLLILVVLFSGCLSSNQVTTQSPAEPESTCLEYLTPYMTENWDSNNIYVSYSAPSNYSGHLVVFINDSVISSDYLHYNQTVDADGHQIKLDTNLTGTHPVRVVEYNDSRSDGDLNLSDDKVCQSEGGAQSTDEVKVNFGDNSDT